MAKYLIETYYTCSIKVSHYLDDINESELNKLEERDDGKFEIIDIKLDNRKTKNLNAKINGENIKETNIEKIYFLALRIILNLSLGIIGGSSHAIGIYSLLTELHWGTTRKGAVGKTFK